MQNMDILSKVGKQIYFSLSNRNINDTLM